MTRAIVPFGAALVAAAASSCVIVADDASLTLRNRSSSALVAVHLADVDDWSWGPDLLPGTLYPGEELVIDEIRCDHYDVMVVDRDGDECVLPDLHLCFDDHVWTITDFTLSVCPFM